MHQPMSLLHCMQGPAMTRRLTVALVALLAMAGIARADYASYVLGLEPSLYYRLNETAVGTVLDSSTPAAAAVHSSNVLVTDVNQTPARWLRWTVIRSCNPMVWPLIWSAWKASSSREMPTSAFRFG